MDDFSLGEYIQLLPLASSLCFVTGSRVRQEVVSSR
jgi:hypothetical protein